MTPPGRIFCDSAGLGVGRAVGRLMEQGARSLGDSRKLSLYMGKVLDLMREADYWAGEADRPVVTAADVRRAVEARIFRSDRVRQRIQESMLRETVLVDTTGTAVGQVNGLSVLQIGDFPFDRSYCCVSVESRNDSDRSKKYRYKRCCCTRD